MSRLELSVRLNPSFDEWYGARAVVEEELQAIGKALERIRISSQLQNAFTGHLFAVHRQYCEACPSAREPGLSGAGLEKESPTNIPSRAAAAHNPMKPKKTSVSCVSTFTQTIDMNGLQMNTQGEVDDNNDDISETSAPSSVTCHVEDEESQADVNRTLEKPSTEKVVSTKSMKLEVSEDEPFPDVLLGLEKDHSDVDMDSSKEETPSQQIHEEEVPSQLIKSGEQSHLERTNTVSDPLVKHERDFQGHCDFGMAGSSSEAMSHQEPVEEIPRDRSDGQLHVERMNKVSYQPIKHEEHSQGHCGVDMAGSSCEAMSHQGTVEENQLDRSDGQLHLEGMDKVSDQPIKHEENSQGHCDFDMAGSSSEAMSHQGAVEENRLDRSDGQLRLEGMDKVSDQLIKHEEHSQGHCDFDMAGSSSEAMSHQGTVEENRLDRSDGQLCLEGMDVSDQPIKHKKDSQGHCYVDMAGCSSEVMSHQGPVEEIPLDRSDGANNTISALNCDVLSQVGVFKDPCLDSYKKVQKTSRTDDGANNSALDCEVLGPSGVSADQCPTDLDSDQNVEKTSVTDDGTKNGSSSLNCDVLTKEASADECITDLDSYEKGQKNSGSDCKMKFHCSYCSKSYSCMKEYQKHLNTYTCEKPYQCSVCSKRFSRKVSFDTHMKHKGEKCCTCSYQCYKKPILTDHTKIHTGIYNCSSCDKIFDHKGDMERHMEKHFKCDHCCSKTANKSNGQVHRRRMEKHYKCDHCTYTCGTKQHLKNHKRVHTGERPHECSLCGKRFRKPSVLKIHMRTHSGEKPYSCNICDYRSSDKGNLTRHMRVHTGEKPYECSLCGKRFPHSDALKRHMRTHNGEKPYSCDICDFRCSQKGDLKIHMGVHTGEKPHVCSLCGKRFLHSCNLKSHMRIHSGEKPYSCDICNYRCAQKGRLTIHMNVHTGEKPHRCSLCGKRFLQSSDLKRHMMKHS